VLQISPRRNDLFVTAASRADVVSSGGEFGTSLSPAASRNLRERDDRPWAREDSPCSRCDLLCSDLVWGSDWLCSGFFNSVRSLSGGLRVTDGALADGSAVSVEELARPDRVANVEKNQALIGAHFRWGQAMLPLLCFRTQDGREISRSRLSGTSSVDSSCDQFHSTNAYQGAIGRGAAQSKMVRSPPLVVPIRCWATAFRDLLARQQA